MVDADHVLFDAQGFARELVSRYGVAADVAIHAPHREGDQRNWHAHVLTTTRELTAEEKLIRALVGEALKNVSEPHLTAEQIALRARDVPAVISGAGPTVLAFPPDGLLPSEVDTAGFTVLPSYAFEGRHVAAGGARWARFRGRRAAQVEGGARSAPRTTDSPPLSERNEPKASAAS